MHKNQSEPRNDLDSQERLTAQTISDFGEQWTTYQANPGYYGSVNLLTDHFGLLFYHYRLYPDCELRT